VLVQAYNKINPTWAGLFENLTAGGLVGQWAISPEWVMLET